MDKEELDCKDVRSCTIVWQLLDDVQERWKWLIQLILAAAVTITVQALSPLWPLSFEFKVDVINLVTSGPGPRLVIPEWATVLGPGKTIWMPFSSRCCHYRVWFSGSVTRRVWQCDIVTVKMVTWSRVTILTRSRLSDLVVCVIASWGRVWLLAGGVMCHVWPASWQRDTHDSVKYWRETWEIR